MRFLNLLGNADSWVNYIPWMNLNLLLSEEVQESDGRWETPVGLQSVGDPGVVVGHDYPPTLPYHHLHPDRGMLFWLVVYLL